MRTNPIIKAWAFIVVVSAWASACSGSTDEPESDTGGVTVDATFNLPDGSDGDAGPDTDASADTDAAADTDVTGEDVPLEDVPLEDVGGDLVDVNEEVGPDVIDDVADEPDDVGSDPADDAPDMGSAPVADDQDLNTSEETPLAIELTGSDADDDDLTFEVVDFPRSGTLSGSEPNFVYTPDDDFDGEDSFTFEADDGSLTSDEATVSITVDNGTVRYLEVGGSNENDGLTVDTALATLEEALLRSDLDGGDIIYIGSGTFDGRVTIAHNGLEIHGDPSGETTLDGELTGRVVSVQSGADVELTDVGITNGYEESVGGLSNGGTLYLQDVNIYENIALNSTGGLGNDGNLVMEDSFIVNNTAGDSGVGGLYNGINTMTLCRVSIVGNSASGPFGAMDNIGTLLVEDTLIQDNHAGSVDNGIINQGTATFVRSTISLNTPGADVAGDEYGGAFHNQGNGTLTLINCTVTGNGAVLYGAAFVQPEGLNTINLVHSTIYDNDSPGPAFLIYGGTITFDHTIVGENDSSNCSFGDAAVAISLGYNLEDGNTCRFDSVGDQVNTSVSLGPLQQNGGHTPTMMPGVDNSIVDMGATSCPSVSDQRGTARPLDGNDDGETYCDIGAVELRDGE